MSQAQGQVIIISDPKQIALEISKIIVENGYLDHHVSRKPIGIKQAAEYLGIGLSKIRELVALNQIPHFRVGDLIRFRESDLDNWQGTPSSKEEMQAERNQNVSVWIDEINKNRRKKSV